MLHVSADLYLFQAPDAGTLRSAMAGGSIHDLRIDRSGGGRETSYLLPILLFLGLGILVGAGLWFWRADAVLELVVKPVAVQSGASGRSTVLNATGYVTARRSATVSSKVSGKIMEILVEEGDVVKEGQVLARLDTVNVNGILELAEAQLKASEASTDETAVLLREAELELERVTRLAGSKIASQADLDQAQARVASLEGRLRRLRAEVVVAERQVAVRRQDLDDLEIRAPFAGVVISKDAQPGEVISPVSAGSGFTRTGICTLVDMGSLEIEVDVNESFINRVYADQTVTAVLDAYTDWRIKASVIAIVPAADRQKATVKVRIRLEETDERILPEMGVKVSFQAPARDSAEDSSEAIASIDLGSLFEESGKQYVWVVVGGKVEKRAVRVAAKDEKIVLIEAGLRSGEIVVVDPPAELKNGLEVKVKSL